MNDDLVGTGAQYAFYPVLPRVDSSSPTRVRPARPARVSSKPQGFELFAAAANRIAVGMT